MDFDPTVTSMFASDVTGRGPAAGEGSEIRPDYHPPATSKVFLQEKFLYRRLFCATKF
jgi:hypothetical protein